MRLAIMAATLLLTACAIPIVGGPRTSTTATTLTAADAATALAVGQQVTMTIATPTQTPPDGEDPVIIMQLRHGDGRLMSFDEANHAPMHVMAQTPGGPLAQAMGLFGEERPTLYSARPDEGRGEPFICGRDGGPHAVGVYRAADGAVLIVGLKQDIGFDTRPDGSYSPLPYSPDQVCARLAFRQG